MRLSESKLDIRERVGFVVVAANMSGGIEEPYTIATLPKARDNGRIQAAPVHSLNGSRKRKRHEIALGVDGESVNIYNVGRRDILRI